MNRRRAKTTIVLAGLVALSMAGTATGQSTAKLWSSDVVADRQRLMKLNGASWADAQAKLKAGNAEAVAANAETMALTATMIPSLFPEGSLTDKSKAKPEIWQKWSEFEAAAKNLGAQAEKLRDAARSKDLAATEAVAKDFGRQACGTCHQPFRVPPPRAPAPPQQLQPR
jgi:cytochrome c556